MSPSDWQIVIAVLTVLVSLYTVISASRAKRAESLAVAGKLELEGMQVSVDSLQRSNADLRTDNNQLRTDLADERREREALAAELHEMREEFRRYKQESIDQRRALQNQIISLGGKL